LDGRCFLVQIAARGTARLFREGNYRNDSWMRRDRNKSHGLIEPGDRLLIYITSDGLRYSPVTNTRGQGRLSYIYRVVDVSDDHKLISLVEYCELERRISLDEIRMLVAQGLLPHPFSQLGKQGFNIALITRESLRRVEELSIRPRMGDGP